MIVICKNWVWAPHSKYGPAMNLTKLIPGSRKEGVWFNAIGIYNGNESQGGKVRIPMTGCSRLACLSVALAPSLPSRAPRRASLGIGIHTNRPLLLKLFSFFFFSFLSFLGAKMGAGYVVRHSWLFYRIVCSVKRKEKKKKKEKEKLAAIFLPCICLREGGGERSRMSLKGMRKKKKKSGCCLLPCLCLREGGERSRKLL